MNKAGLYCSFCGKSESEVKHIVEGPGKVGICDECSELVESIMEPYRPLRAAASTSTEAVPVAWRYKQPGWNYWKTTAIEPINQSFIVEPLFLTPPTPKVTT